MARPDRTGISAPKDGRRAATQRETTSRGTPSRRTTRAMFFSSTAMTDGSPTRSGSSSPGVIDQCGPVPTLVEWEATYPSGPCSGGGSCRAGNPQQTRPQFSAGRNPCCPLNSHEAGASGTSIPMPALLPPRCSIRTMRRPLRSLVRRARPQQSATTSIATMSPSVSSTLLRRLPGDAAHHRRRFLSRDGTFPSARHAADLAASVRIWPRLSRFHRTLRICASRCHGWRMWRGSSGHGSTPITPPMRNR